MRFGNHPFGVSSTVEILHNEGLFNDVEKALKYYEQIFGITEALLNLKSVYFKNGYYEFYFEEKSKRLDQSIQQLVQFVLVLDWDNPSCLAKIAGNVYEYKQGDFYDTEQEVNYV